MFNEREMSKAIDWLFELFSPKDYEGYDEDEIGYAGGLCLPEVCTALRGAAQTVYQYSVAGGYEKCWSDTIKPHTQGGIMKNREGVEDGTEIQCRIQGRRAEIS